MEIILSQIERALEKDLHYLAVVSALTLPDICAALEASDGSTSKFLYMAWWDKWKVSDYYVTGEELYSLRCGMLHQGRNSHPRLQYSRILFMIRPGCHRCVSILNHAGGEEKVLQLDASIFCRDMMTSVRSWYEANKDDANVKNWLPYVLTFRPQGLPPHFVGMPLIG